MAVLKAVLSGLGEVLRSWRGALLVQMQSLGFWRGRQFRMYHEFNLAGGASTTLQFAATKPFLLTHQSLLLVGGDARAVIKTGSTPSGTFTPVTTQNPKYRIGMEPVSTVTVSTGGTVTGGTEREVLLSAASTGGATKSALGETTLASIRGLPATTFYQTITAGTNGAVGIYSVEWEDLD